MAYRVDFNKPTFLGKELVYIQEAICYLFQRRPSYAQTNGFPCRTTYGASASCLFATRRTT